MTGLPADDLIPLAQALLEVPPDLVETALGLELQDGTVIADQLDGRRCVFLAALYRAEREIAEKLKALARHKPPWPGIDADKAIPWVEARTKLVLAESQKQALRTALGSNVLVITGGPGVGKTTLVNSLLKILIVKSVSIALCAPTGRAAKRLSESTGLEAKTIHRLLETDPRTPVRIQAPCVCRKIATRLKRDGAESHGFVGGLRTTPTQRTTKEKTYFVFNDIDLKRVRGSSALIGEHTSSTPF